MKKLLLMAAAAAFTFGLAIADAPDRDRPMTHDELLKPLYMLEASKNTPQESALVELEDTGWMRLLSGLTISYNGIASIYNIGNFISYEPISNTVALPIPLGYISPPNGNAIIGAHTQVWAIKNSELRAAYGVDTLMSQFRGRFVMFDTITTNGSETGLSGIVPNQFSLSVANPDGMEQDVENLNYALFTGTFGIDRGVTPIEFTAPGGRLNLHYPELDVFFGDGNAQIDEVSGPKNNNPDDQKFQRTTMKMAQGNYGGDWDNVFMNAGLLDNERTGTGQFDDTYGVNTIRLSSTGALEIQSSIPPAFRTDEFRSDASYFSGNIFVDRLDGSYDGAGTAKEFWAGVNAFFSDDFDNRKFAVSTSQNGRDYASWNKIPVADMEENFYASVPELQNLPDGYRTVLGGSSPYTRLAFTVLNDDEAAFFSHVTIALADNPTYYYLVQITYNKQTDAWRMERIADELDPVRFDLLHLEDFNDNARAQVESQLGTNSPVWFYDQSFNIGSSIDISKNLNGDILVKYTKQTDLIPMNTPLEVFQQDNDGNFLVPEDNVLDSAYADEVFFALKANGSTEWKEYQVTYDRNQIHNHTFIPSRFDQLTNVPTLHIRKIDPTRYNPGAFRDRVVPLDPITWHMYTQGAYDVRVGQTDLTVENPNRVGSAEEEKPSFLDLNISMIKPNPTSDELTVGFSLANAANVELSLVNSAGTKVLDIFNGETYGVNVKNGIDVSELPQGVYYLALTANGQTVTKMVQIRR
ncbi:MAG: hypothetical protein Kapaf2KO_01540 [Candidatus Kapaibacteriales bacterium]